MKINHVNIPYKCFPNFVLRTPLLPISTFHRLTNGKKVTDDLIKQIFADPIVSEAIYLASPELYREAKKWLVHNDTNEKLKFTLLKYIARMSSRCTPFGLFAGCSIGEISERTSIFLNTPSANKRHTRLDMNFLVALSQNLLKISLIRQQLLFYPNSSIYELGNKLRYVEYQYVNGNRQHCISAVDNSEYLNRVLEKSKRGAQLHELAIILVDDEITIEDANKFVEELVESQILVSELEPAISGPEFMDQIINVLHKMSGTEKMVATLLGIDRKIKKIDAKIGNAPTIYDKIIEDLNDLEISFNPKYIFQTDMEINCLSNKLDLKIIDSVKKGLMILNKITPQPNETRLSQFKNSFYERYEEREIILSQALDTEIGVGYRQNEDVGDTNPLVDDIQLPIKNTQNNKIEIDRDSFQSLLFEKINLAQKENHYQIRLTDNDLQKFNQTWSDLPDTMYAVIELLKIEGEEKIKFNGIGGSSAANLLSRFGHGNAQMKKLTQQIVDMEENIKKDQILAEIIHLPESRVGNILMHPTFRKYEIPYLAKSVLKDDFQLPLSDLLISVRNNSKIRLRSKKTGKEILPRLTNAHNYHENSLPIYHFLADLQTQDVRNTLGLNMGAIYNDLGFVPRIEYENLILQEAMWNIQSKEVSPILDAIDSDDLFILKLKKFLEDRQIPNEVKLVDGDNHLLINFNNLTSARLLFETVRKRPQFKLIESLFEQECIVNGSKGCYTNQVILSFYKDKNFND